MFCFLSRASSSRCTHSVCSSTSRAATLTYHSCSRCLRIGCWRKIELPRFKICANRHASCCLALASPLSRATPSQLRLDPFPDLIRCNPSMPTASHCFCASGLALSPAQLQRKHLWRRLCEQSLPMPPRLQPFGGHSSPEQLQLQLPPFR